MRRAVVNLSYTNSSLLVTEERNGQLVTVRKEHIPFPAERYSTRELVLSEKGSSVLAADVSALLLMASEMGCGEVSVISTTLLRKTANPDEVRRILEKETGASVRQVTGYEEARALWCANERYLCLERPLLINIGVSSTEISDYSRPDPSGMVSFPFGAEDMAGRFVGGRIPTKEEARRIRDFMLPQLDAIGDARFENAVLTGRNLNAVYSIYADFFSVTEGEERLMQRGRLGALTDALLDRKRAERLIMRNCPDKALFIIPAAVMLKTAVGRFRTNNMTVSPLGIKEGWIKMMTVKERNEGRTVT